MQKRRQGITALLWMLFLLIPLSLLVDLYVLVQDQQAQELEAFELAARMLGYCLSLLSLALCAWGALRLRRGGRRGGDARAQMLLGMGAAVLLFVHDVLLYLEYGNVLEGTFTMAAFFALDVCLLLLYFLAVYQACKSPEHGVDKRVCLGAMLVWAVYIVGDMAGYPTAAIADWDEALMKLGFVFPFLLQLLAAEKAQPSAA